MPPLSEFEKQRQQNIARNKELLKKLNLGSLSSDFKRELPQEQDVKKRAGTTKSKPQKRVKKEPVQPTRRSSRLAGVAADSGEEKSLNEDLERQRKEKEELERLKRIRLSGDLSLSDVLVSKEEDGDHDSKLAKLGKAISLGDFYEDIKKKDQNAPAEVHNARESLEQLSLYERFHPNDIRLTAARVSACLWHPAVTRKVAVAGDTTGEMGIWSIDDDTEDEPEVSHFKYHGKNVAKFVVRPEDPHEIVSCSYDGSIRTLDLEKQVSGSLLEFDTMYGDASGVSDIQFVDRNLCYFTTLDGEFSSFDVREPNKRRVDLDVLRLHDKKIGSFAVNPNSRHQLVTASLDRSLRIWDLRKTQHAHWSEYEDAVAPHCLGSYRSRLSVSTADWNTSNDIVCNGYDDTINVFQLGDTTAMKPPAVFKPVQEESENGIPVNLEPTNTLRHNCQTGRWVSILKARWQQEPADGVQKFVIANMKRSIDVFDRNGTQLAHLTDDNMTSVPAVCAFHPTQNWILGGNASGKGFFFA